MMNLSNSSQTILIEFSMENFTIFRLLISQFTMILGYILFTIFDDFSGHILFVTALMYFFISFQQYLLIRKKAIRERSAVNIHEELTRTELKQEVSRIRWILFGVPSLIVLYIFEFIIHLIN